MDSSFRVDGYGTSTSHRIRSAEEEKNNWFGICSNCTIEFIFLAPGTAVTFRLILPLQYKTRMQPIIQIKRRIWNPFDRNLRYIFLCVWRICVQNIWKIQKKKFKYQWITMKLRWYTRFSFYRHHKLFGLKFDLRLFFTAIISRMWFGRPISNFIVIQFFVCLFKLARTCYISKIKSKKKNVFSLIL